MDAPIKFYIFRGEDTLARANERFKNHLIAAEDEEAARKLVPYGFRVDRVDESEHFFENPPYGYLVCFSSPEQFVEKIEKPE